MLFSVFSVCMATGMIKIVTSFYMISILVGLEMVTVALFALACFTPLFESVSTVIVFLTVSVCEGVVGLSLMVTASHVGSLEGSSLWKII